MAAADASNRANACAFRTADGYGFSIFSLRAFAFDSGLGAFESFFAVSRKACQHGAERFGDAARQSKRFETESKLGLAMNTPWANCLRDSSLYISPDRNHDVIAHRDRIGGAAINGLPDVSRSRAYAAREFDRHLCARRNNDLVTRL